MSEEKVFSVSIYYSGSYHIDVEATDKESARKLAIELLKDEVDYYDSLESVEVFESGE